MAARAAGAAALAAALLAGPAPLAGQAAEDPEGRAGLTVTVHAGGTAFTRFQSVTLEHFQPEGQPARTYSADLAASTAAALGADLTVWFRPWLGARLDFAYAPSNFELRLAEDDRIEVLGEDADYRGLDYSDVSMYSLTLTGELALPIPSRHIATYALVGAGAMLLTADDRGANGLQRSMGGSGSAFDVAGIAGLGVKIPLRGGSAGRVALSFELVDRVTRSAVVANDDRVLYEDEDLRVISRLHPADQDGDARWVHSVGIAAGLTFATGGVTPVDRAGRQ